MSPQQHADHLLAVWQQRRDLPPELRLPPKTGPIVAESSTAGAKDAA